MPVHPTHVKLRQVVLAWPCSCAFWMATSLTAAAVRSESSEWRFWMSARFWRTRRGSPWWWQGGWPTALSPLKSCSSSEPVRPLFHSSELAEPYSVGSSEEMSCWWTGVWLSEDQLSWIVLHHGTAEVAVALLKSDLENRPCGGKEDPISKGGENLGCRGGVEG